LKIVGDARFEVPKAEKIQVQVRILKFSTYKFTRIVIFFIAEFFETDFRHVRLVGAVQLETHAYGEQTAPF
jgi:hypothetical protein